MHFVHTLSQLHVTCIRSQLSHRKNADLTRDEEANACFFSLLTEVKNKNSKQLEESFSSLLHFDTKRRANYANVVITKEDTKS